MHNISLLVSVVVAFGREKRGRNSRNFMDCSVQKNSIFRERKNRSLNSVLDPQIRTWLV